VLEARGPTTPMTPRKSAAALDLGFSDRTEVIHRDDLVEQPHRGDSPRRSCRAAARRGFTATILSSSRTEGVHRGDLVEQPHGDDLVVDRTESARGSRYRRAVASILQPGEGSRRQP
jgi:hypothetical protein